MHLNIINKKRGFTLIELMIVIAIIAILAAILIPNFLHARAESVTAACEGNEKQIATAMEEYAVDNAGAYPATYAGLTTPYLSTQITDPVKSGNTYTLNVPATLNTNDGSYEIVDAGGHDSTTTGSLVTTAGAACGTSCVSILYAQASGIHGK